MEYRRLGKAGVQVSALSLGSWVTFGQQIVDEVASDLMKTAYDNGVNFFDNAEGVCVGAIGDGDGQHPSQDGMAARHLPGLEQGVLGR